MMRDEKETKNRMKCDREPPNEREREEGEEGKDDAEGMQW